MLILHTKMKKSNHICAMVTTIWKSFGPGPNSMEKWKPFYYSGRQDCGCIFISIDINTCIENNHLKFHYPYFKIYLSHYLKNIFVLLTAKHFPDWEGKKEGRGDPTSPGAGGGERQCQAGILALENLAPTPHIHCGAQVSVYTENTGSLSYFSELDLKTAEFHPRVGSPIFRHNLK